MGGDGGVSKVDTQEQLFSCYTQTHLKWNCQKAKHLNHLAILL